MTFFSFFRKRYLLFILNIVLKITQPVGDALDGLGDILNIVLKITQPVGYALDGLGDPKQLGVLCRYDILHLLAIKCLCTHQHGHSIYFSFLIRQAA